MKKVKITEAGQPCRHCETPVELRSHDKPLKYKSGSYWFEWWLACPKCRAIYMQESAKRWFDGAPPMPVATLFANRAKGQQVVEASLAAKFSQWCRGE